MCICFSKLKAVWYRGLGQKLIFRESWSEKNVECWAQKLQVNFLKFGCFTVWFQAWQWNRDCLNCFLGWSLTGCSKGRMVKFILLDLLMTSDIINHGAFLGYLPVLHSRIWCYTCRSYLWWVLVLYDISMIFDLPCCWVSHVSLKSSYMGGLSCDIHLILSSSSHFLLLILGRWWNTHVGLVFLELP